MRLIMEELNSIGSPLAEGINYMGLGPRPHSRASLSFKPFLRKYKFDNEVASRDLMFLKFQDGDLCVIVIVSEMSEDRKPMTSLLF